MRITLVRYGLFVSKRSLKKCKRASEKILLVYELMKYKLMVCLHIC